MTTTVNAGTAGAIGIPAGTWQLDPIHSVVGFAVRHNLIATFRGAFKDVDATLVTGEDAATLVGSAKVASVVVDDENLVGHLQSPDFFDAARHPELTFRSSAIGVDGERFTVAGEITIKGTTKAIELTGELGGTVTDAYGSERVGLELSTDIDRTDFGLDWNAPLPKGGFVLSDRVKIEAHLEFVQAQA